LANDFVDATLAGIAAKIRPEYDQLTRDGSAECRKVVEQILSGAPFSRERAEARLGYPLDRSHIAAIIWSDQPEGDPGRLDRIADALSHAAGCPRPLTVDASSESRWVWVNEVAPLDSEQIHPVLTGAPQVRVAIGTAAIGVDGFRRSHLEALATQRMMSRLRSHQRVARFADVQMVALLTENADGAVNFIEATLGDFAAASPLLQHTVLIYISEQCNASRAAKRLFTHRNTLLHRLETAERLLPRPLDQATIEVAVALQALQWRGDHTGDSTGARTQEHHNGAVPTARHEVPH
jgi:DNA-binding PucR family transcriptional regulator